MKKIGAMLLSLALILTLMSGCGGGDQSAQTPVAGSENQMMRSNSKGGSWTVLIYLCGTDLESQGGFATVNLEEIMDATYSEKVNVIIQTGGTEEWEMEEINPDELERWQAVDGGIERVDSQPLAGMGEASTLGEFLQWGVKTYPADKYMCLLWDHGGGSVAGIAADELFDYDTLDLKELAKGVSMAGTQFEVVGFDACLMATIETAAALSPYAKYMVASQELEPGSGWDYTYWLDFLADTPTATGLELGKEICDSFYEKCDMEGMGSLATLSVTDLSKIPALVQSFDKMAAELKSFTSSPEKLQPITQAMVRAESYGGNNDSEGYTNMVDLGDLTICSQGVVSATGEELLDNLFAAVPYNVAGEGREKSNGLSVYVPLGVAEGELDSYAQLAAVSGEYLRFIEGIYDWKAPQDVVINQPVVPQAQPSQPQGEQEEELPVAQSVPLSGISIAEAINHDDFELEYSLGLSDDGYVLLNIDNGADIISTVAFDLFYHDEESNALWYLGSDYDVNMSDDGTQYWDNFRNVWTIINDSLCMMEALSFTDEYILYTVPVVVNDKDTNLRMLYHMETGEYEVIGTWDGIDGESGMSSRDVKKLVDGDEVTFVFTAADLETLEAYEFLGDSFIVDGPVIAEEATLFDGDYYYQYVITDIFGEIYESDMAMLTSVDGEITVELLE
ncbi:MAG: clostripain-related cysteine peptidase [Oscillospiraceae bacterium]